MLRFSPYTFRVQVCGSNTIRLSICSLHLSIYLSIRSSIRSLSNDLSIHPLTYLYAGEKLQIPPPGHWGDIYLHTRALHTYWHTYTVSPPSNSTESRRDKRPISTNASTIPHYTIHIFASPCRAFVRFGFNTDKSECESNFTPHLPESALGCYWLSHCHNQ